MKLEDHGCSTGDCPHSRQIQCDEAVGHDFAMMRLEKLAPYMGEKERERLVREGRSETYTTYIEAFILALEYGRKPLEDKLELCSQAQCGARIVELEAELASIKESRKTDMRKYTQIQIELEKFQRKYGYLYVKEKT